MSTPLTIIFAFSFGLIVGFLGFFTYMKVALHHDWVRSKMFAILAARWPNDWSEACHVCNQALAQALCNDPDCPEHGTSEMAEARRASGLANRNRIQ